MTELPITPVHPTTGGETSAATGDDLRERVRTRYAAAARAVTSSAAARSVTSSGAARAVTSSAAAGSVTSSGGARSVTSSGAAGCTPAAARDGCCAGPVVEPRFGAGLYDDADLGELPEQAVLASLGCGNPLAVAELNDGETVLDLGSGGGIDVLLSARRVGPAGRAYGLDMTDEMLELARANAARAGAGNVEFRKGHIEDIPLPDASVDVVISNCVVNLSADKPAVFAQIHRVLRPGGRIGITDVVADDHLAPAQRAARGDRAGCVAGALTFAEYRDQLAAAGLTDIAVTPTHQVADAMHSAVIKARKPS